MATHDNTVITSTGTRTNHRAVQRAARAKPDTRRVAVITGGAAGLGLGIARRLAADGMAIVISDLDEGKLSAARQEFEAAGLPIETFKGEVSRPEDQKALSKTVKTYPKSDVYDLEEAITGAGTGEATPDVMTCHSISICAPTPYWWLSTG